MTDVTGRGPVLRSKLDTRSDDYRSNLDAMQALWDRSRSSWRAVPSIGGQRYVDRHRARGKMLVRERVEALVDPRHAAARAEPAGGVGERDPDRRRRRCNAIGVVEGVECRDQRHRHDVPRRLDEPDDRSTRASASTRSSARNRLPWITPQRVGRRRPAAPGRHLHAGWRRLQEPDPALASSASRRSRSGSARRPPAARTRRG